MVQTYGWVGAVRNQEWSYTKSGSRKRARTHSTSIPALPPLPYQPQLYNLQNDPKELTDVAEKYPDVARQMSAKMKEYIASGEGMTPGQLQWQSRAWTRRKDFTPSRPGQRWH